MRTFKYIFSLIILFLVSSSSKDVQADKDTQIVVEFTRNIWEWPFSKTSIWNMPIGSNAIYESDNFESASNVGVDIQHIRELSLGDPERVVYGSEVWGPGRCEGTQNLGFAINIPDNYIVPDAGNSL